MGKELGKVEIAILVGGPAQADRYFEHSPNIPELSKGYRDSERGRLFAPVGFRGRPSAVRRRDVPWEEEDRWRIALNREPVGVRSTSRPAHSRLRACELPLDS
jgi:hypothetical protein